MKETTYLDSTQGGNIITGFDNYMKGTSGAAAQRRKVGPAEQNRVFSRSSISYRPNNSVQPSAFAPFQALPVTDVPPQDSNTPSSTPASHAPTPISASFRDGGATPTSAGGNKGGNKKKNKEAEDSEGDAQTKKRTTFGASRK